MMENWQRMLAGYLPPSLMGAVVRAVGDREGALQEIRLRAGRVPMITLAGQSLPVEQAPLSAAQLGDIFLACCEYSPAARSHQLRCGYVLLRGGLRVGISGRCQQRGDRTESIFPVSGLNIRILREVRGAAERVVGRLRCGGSLYSTLILAPPGGGKTTLLRDAVRILSDGADGGRALRMGIVDERGEIAGCVNGVPTLDVGAQSDVLDGCSKAWGMRTLIRTMAPQGIAVDELGDREDASALMEAARCGVRVMATAHGSALGDLDRPLLRPLMEAGVFERVVVLGAVPGSELAVHSVGRAECGRC